MQKHTADQRHSLIDSSGFSRGKVSEESSMQSLGMSLEDQYESMCNSEQGPKTNTKTYLYSIEESFKKLKDRVIEYERNKKLLQDYINILKDRINSFNNNADFEISNNIQRLQTQIRQQKQFNQGLNGEILGLKQVLEEMHSFVLAGEESVEVQEHHIGWFDG